jgi:hypothetical protein
MKRADPQKNFFRPYVKNLGRFPGWTVDVGGIENILSFL